MNGNNLNGITWKTCARLGATVLILFLVIRYWSGFENFLFLLFNGVAAIVAGFIIAYVVNIPMRFFERKLPGVTGDGTRNRALSMGLAITCIVLVVLFVGVLVVPQLVNAIIALSTDVPQFFQSLSSNEFISSLIPHGVLSTLIDIDWDQVIADAGTWLQSGVMSSLPQLATFIGQVGAWFMGFIFSFWFLAEKNRLGTQCHRLSLNYLGEVSTMRLERAIDLFDDSFRRYIVAQSLEATIFGWLVALVSFLFGLPHALMLGSLVGIMSLIPMVGALIGAVLGAIIILATSWQKAVLFLIVFFIVQQIEANVVYKRVVGKRVGLKGMWPLIGVTLGVSLFGIAGGFAGVPVTAAIFRMVEADLARRESAPEHIATPLEKIRSELSDE